MGFMNSKKKIAVIATLITTIAAGTIAYAATPVKQDAYYDTFKFIVNGGEQFISDTALKPFIANSRVYVPIATLQSLGIANVTWNQSSAGQSASLTVTPKDTGVDSNQMSALQQQIAILTTSLNAKDLESKKLLQENTDLKAQIAELKKTTTTTPAGELNAATLKSLNDYYYNKLYRNSFSDSYKDGNESKKIDVNFDATVSSYRDELDIELVTDRNFSKAQWDLSVKKDPYYFERYVQKEIIEPALSEFKNPKDLRININIYDKDKRTGSRIATGTYDRDRLTLTIN